MSPVTKSLLLDIDLCIGCKSCGAACNYSHGGGGALGYCSVRAQAVLPLLCRHCDEPACVAACHSEALSRTEEGVVLRSDVVCTGCRSCVFACPFGAINWDLVKRVVSKCDLCLDQLEQGERPACVGTCPSGALAFEEVAQMGSRGLVQLASRVLSRDSRTGRRIPR